MNTNRNLTPNALKKYLNRKISQSSFTSTKESRANLVNRIKDIISQVNQNNILESIEITEESEEMQTIREVLEIPQDTISVNIRTIVPISFIRLDLEIRPKE